MEDEKTQALVLSSDNSSIVCTVWFHKELYFFLYDILRCFCVSEKITRSYCFFLFSLLQVLRVANGV